MPPPLNCFIFAFSRKEATHKMCICNLTHRRWWNILSQKLLETLKIISINMYDFIHNGHPPSSIFSDHCLDTKLFYCQELLKILFCELWSYPIPIPPPSPNIISYKQYNSLRTKSVPVFSINTFYIHCYSSRLLLLFSSP